MSDYNSINAHARDTKIKFEPAAHKYYVTCADGRCIECESVTTVIGNLFGRFDARYWASRKTSTPAEADALIRKWEAKAEEARMLGTQLHDRIEHHYLGEEPTPSALADRAFGYFLDFARTYPLTPYRSEWPIFSEKYRIAGTLDFLAHSDGRFTIYDWKRSSKIVDRFGCVNANCFGKYALQPIPHIPDTTYHHYALQVSLYRYILESEYGITVDDAFLGTFHPDYDRFHVVPMPYLRREVIEILKSRL